MVDDLVGLVDLGEVAIVVGPSVLEVGEVGSVGREGRVDAGDPHAGLEGDGAVGPGPRLGARVVEELGVCGATVV